MYSVTREFLVMPDHFFQFAFQPNTPSEHVARLAVLYRLHHLGKKTKVSCPKTPEQWKETLALVMGMWRQRILDLRDTGTSRFDRHQISRARNCHPWGVAVQAYATSARYCRKFDICPWCFGRSVSALYTTYQRTRRSGDALIAVTNADFIDDEPIAALRLKLDWSKLIMRGLVRAHEWARATYWQVTIEPTPASKSRGPDFCIRSRLLMQLPIGSPTILIPDRPGWKLNRVNNPDEATSQLLVSRVCAYPTGLLTGTPEKVHKSLLARAGLRLSEQSGEFRGQVVETEQCEV